MLAGQVEWRDGTIVEMRNYGIAGFPTLLALDAGTGVPRGALVGPELVTAWFDLRFADVMLELLRHSGATVVTRP